LLTWLLVTLCVALVSSLIPFLSMEVFVVAFAAHHPHLPVLLFGFVIAVGQVAGKLVYFYAARGSIHLPAFVHRKTGAAVLVAAGGVPAPVTLVVDRPRRTGVGARWHRVVLRVRAGWEWLRVRCHRHPGWMMGATATSALVGIPPFLATTVLAGLAGLSLRAFVAASFPTRFARFAILAASPGLVLHWWPAIHHHMHVL
jgi:membrane protein YqaA with SNARE-associated domain